MEQKQRRLITGHIADYYMDDGILVSLSKPVLRTVDVIRENIALVKEITGGKPVPLLIFLSPSPVPDKATRRYSAEHIHEIYSAMAMVSKPGLGSLVMRMVFAFKPSPIPVKQFTDEQAARQWLMQFIPGRST